MTNNKIKPIQPLIIIQLLNGLTLRFYKLQWRKI